MIVAGHPKCLFQSCEHKYVSTSSLSIYICCEEFKQWFIYFWISCWLLVKLTICSRLRSSRKWTTDLINNRINILWEWAIIAHLWLPHFFELLYLKQLVNFTSDQLEIWRLQKKRFWNFIIQGLFFILHAADVYE